MVNEVAGRQYTDEQCKNRWKFKRIIATTTTTTTKTKRSKATEDNSGNISIEESYVAVEMQTYLNERLSAYHDRLKTGKIDSRDQFSKQGDEMVYEELTLEEIEMHRRYSWPTKISLTSVFLIANM